MVLDTGEADQVRGIGDVQRPEGDSVNERENCGVGADAEGESDDGCESGARSAAISTEGEPNSRKEVDHRASPSSLNNQ